jgi:K+-transporting ATPase ATPase A chain
VCGIDLQADMPWTRYAYALLALNLLGVLVVYALQRLQLWLPLNPLGLTNTSPDLAFKTAVSFASKTNWQSYSGEATLSHLAQMTGFTRQNVLSAASGMAVLVALTHGFLRRETSGVGHFWVDVVRFILYIPLPLVLLLALALARQGVVQTLSPSAKATLLQPVTYGQPALGPDGLPVHDAHGHPVMVTVTTTEQVIARGPAASQVAIKQLGTNGGGFFSVNSAHPFENPTPLSNLLELLAILPIPAALCFTFGRLVGDLRQGLVLLAAMTMVFIPLLSLCVGAEQTGNPLFDRLRLLPRPRGSRREATWLARRRALARQLAPVGHRHHGRLQRLGQCHA